MDVGSWFALGLILLLVWFSFSTGRLAQRYAQLVRENLRSWNTSRAVAISRDEEIAYIASSLFLFQLALVVLRRMKKIAENMPTEDDFLDYAKSIRFLCLSVAGLIFVYGVQHEISLLR